MMKIALRSFGVTAACCLCAGAVWLGLGLSGGGAVASSGDAALPGLSLGRGPLTVPGLAWLDGGLQEQDERLARHADPAAVFARERSRSAYAHLSARDVAGLLSRSFPSVIDRPAGAGAAVPRGSRVLGYPSAHALAISLSGGRRGVIESFAPVARRSSSGRFAPIDLSVVRSGGGFGAANPGLSVRIPANISSGVGVPAAGVSLTPVGARGHGSIVGASVVYANVGGRATDAVVKPNASGFQLDAVLRSPSSPARLAYRVGAPSGSRLVLDRGLDTVGVVRRGRAIATILAPSAVDAAGTSVPASVAVVGHTVVVSVAHRADSYLYPVEVDPEVGIDSELATSPSGKVSNWHPESNNPTKFGQSAVYEGPSKERLETKGVAEYSAGNFAAWNYETKGNSKVYELKTKTSAKNVGAKIESLLMFEHRSGESYVKDHEILISTEFSEPEYSEKANHICPTATESCLSTEGVEKNAVVFQQSAGGSPGAAYKFSDIMSEGLVSISEPAGDHSTTHFNTTSPEVEGKVIVEGKEVTQRRPNALYGSGLWIGSTKGALELVAEDPGIGVSATKLEYEKSVGVWEQLSSHNYLEEGKCSGLQCYPTHGEYWTFDPKLPDGEDKIRYRAHEALGGTESPAEEAASTKTIKVDSKAPHGLILTGLPFGEELTEKAYTLTTTATDGEGSLIPNSGIPGLITGSGGEVATKGIAIYVDGQETTEVGAQAGCFVAKGACTAKAEWQINGAELGAGHHTLVFVAIDNAGNEARVTYHIKVRHSTPIALGPGSVDLQSGDFALSATDVAMGLGMTVGRTYSSRNTQAGLEGPLGPQWQLNTGTTETLKEMSDGSIVLADANGKQAIFAKTEAGGFEAPPGDSNLELTVTESFGVKTFYLEDAAKHTKTTFKYTVAGNTAVDWIWTPSKQEGTGMADSVSYSYQSASGLMEYALPESGEPNAVATGSDGRLWAGIVGKSVIRAIPISGSPITEYTLPKSAQINGLTAGPDGKLWFTTSVGGYIGKISTSGKVTEIPTTRAWSGITPGPDGNLWVYSFGENRIAKVTTSGTIAAEYALSAGSLNGITAGPDGNLWFTKYNSAKIGKITTSGVVTEYSLAEGSGPRNIAAGPDGNLWFTEKGTGISEEQPKIGRITPAGTITLYSVPTGSEPWGITAGPDGMMWFTQAKTNKIASITTSGKFIGTVSEHVLPSGSRPFLIVVGRDRKLWFSERTSKKIGTAPSSWSIPEPTRANAPCPGESRCRSLLFKYASSTTATGEAKSEWGDYLGRLKSVLLEVYEPVSKTWQEKTVAEYSYDKLGRLRSEWDPRISPALKTTYGYDAEGHVVTLNPPGQQPWLFTYGTVSGDYGAGRLLKLNRPPATQALWGGEALVNTEAPTISGSPVVGVRLAVSNGKWTGSPLTYGYQWQSCNANGECTRILGATNANYTPTLADVSHTLVATVTALNGDGAVTATATSAKVETREFNKYSLPSGSSPYAIVTGPDGNLWFTDNGSSKIGKITLEGTVTEYALPAGTEPRGIASGPDGNLWYVTWGTSKVGKITTSGAITEYSLPAESHPQDITVGPDNNLWFTDWTTAKVGKITTSGTITEYVVSSNPYDITKGPDGNLWFTMPGSHSVAKITTSGTVTTYASTPTTSEPYGIVTGSDGNLWFADHGTDSVGKVTTTGAVTKYALAVGAVPQAITAGVGGNLYVTNYGNSTIAKVTTSGTVTTYSTGASSGPYGIASGPDEDLWAANRVSNEIFRLNPIINEAGITEGEAKTPQPGTTLEYGVPLSGTGLRTMTSAEVAKWGQTDVPAEATAIIAPDAKQGWPASSYTRATVYYFDEQGRQVNVSSPSTATYGSVSTQEYNEANDVTRTLTPNNRQTALEAGANSVDVAKSLSTYYSYRSMCSRESENNHETESLEEGTRLCDVEGPQHTIKYVVAKEQRESLARLHTKYFYDEEAPAGETYNLQTRSTTLAQLANEEEVEVRKTVTSYSGQSNLGWKLRAPTSLTVDPEGKKLTTTTLYDSVTGQITETRAPAGSGGGSPHDTKFIYYTSAANTEGYAECGSHSEWAGLLCKTLPAKQPETSGVPNLPVTTITSYNIYNEPLVATEAFGATVRTKTKTYDEAGRLTGSETTSTANIALPKLTDEYNSTTGVLEKLSTTVEAKTQTITSKYNTLGQMVEYTDADGNITKYRYGTPENDALLEEVADGSNAGTGKQSYYYDSTTKRLKELVDSAAGKFEASYDADGRLVSELYPNEMCGYTKYNSVGEAIKIEYFKKVLPCVIHSGVWFSESRTPSVRGETLSRSSTLANETYYYDTVGRLTETQETPSGEGCSVRLYGYDEESNRTSQTTRTPGAEGKCATEGGTVLEHTYDAGNRLTDAGIGYDSFGDITKLPAGDAEGHELTTSYYVDGAVASQTQNGVTNGYQLDPEGRVRETSSGLNSTISHYDAPGQAVTWTSETGGKSTRNIPGPDGSLVAVQTNGETPILQLHDLQGNVTATAALSSSETKLLSTYNSTEFGVPNKGTAPPKFAWLGAGDVASSLSSGVITYGSTSYVPQIGRSLQSEVVEAPGIAPGGTGAGAAYVSQTEPWVFQGEAGEAAEAPGREAAREQAAMEAAMAAANIEDPTELMNLKKAEDKASTLLKIATIAEIIDFLDIPKGIVKFVEKYVLDSIGLDVALDWYHDAGDKLMKCAHNKRTISNIDGTYRLNLCLFKYSNVELSFLGIKVAFVYFRDEPRVFECAKQTSVISGENFLNCPYEVYVYKYLE